MRHFIHQLKNWPSFRWDNEDLVLNLGKVRYMQGKLTGQIISLGFDLKSEVILQTLTLDVLKSTEIEGEFLNPEEV